MVNERLTYYVENKGCIFSYQSGIRKKHHGSCLEHEIIKAQLHRECVVAIYFFNIKHKAYDKMWVLLIKLR